jgi:biopolymer transport protein ExbB
MNFLPTAVIVDGTLGALILLSAMTWGVIAFKAFQHARESRRNRIYREAFSGSPSFAFLSRQAPGESALARIVQSGYAVLRSAAEHLHRPEQIWDRQDLVQRTLLQQIQRERKGLESWLAVLATIGNIAPFVGLFGTVWGIMRALTGIASKGSVSIDVVAGPIGEALVATGIGIAVAIPAVIAYNYFQRRLKSSIADFEDFSADFLRLAQLNAFLLAPSHLAAVQGAERKEVA